MGIKPFTYGERRQAAEAWKDGGYMALSRWLSKVRPRFSAAEYGAAVQAAREELQDWTDYTTPVVAARAGEE